MTIEIENLILAELKEIITQILKQNLTAPIQANARAGAEISDFLEKKFVESCSKRKFFFNSEASPEGKTKNPWDARTFLKINDHVEEIWIDFKAFKTSSADSNPDIGTPDKIVKFILSGSFYMCFIHVFYIQDKNGIKFTEHEGDLVKVFFLKDINKSVRRNPKNQLQVNISSPVEIRTRENFIDLLFDKLQESHERQIKISTEKLKNILKLKKDVQDANKKSEAKLLENFHKKK